MKIVEGWSDKSIAATSKLPEEEIKHIIKQFKEILRNTKNIEQEEKYQKEQSQKEKDIENITEAVEMHKGNKFGILTIQNYVNRNRNIEDKVSFYRVRKTIADVLGLTYKRANVVKKVMTQPDRQRRFFESSMI